MPGSSTVWGGSDREVTPWESARTSRTVPPGGRVPKPAALLGAVVPVHWRLWPAVVQGLERWRPTVQWGAVGWSPAGGSERLDFFFSSLSYTSRTLGRRPCAGPGSWARFDFPKKHFVWCFQKMGPRPHKPSPGLHFFGDLVVFRRPQAATHTSSRSGLGHSAVGPRVPAAHALQHGDAPTLRRAPDSPTQHPHFVTLRTQPTPTLRRAPDSHPHLASNLNYTFFIYLFFKRVFLFTNYKFNKINKFSLKVNYSLYNII